MKSKLRDNWIVVGLLALAVAQVSALFLKQGRVEGSGGPRFTTGADLADIIGTDAQGREAPLVAGEPTLLLIFESNCAYCQRVAPTWQAWLEQHRSEVRAVAVSQEPIESATAYVTEKGWGTPVRRVTVARLGSREHNLVSRTPWIYVVDGDGTVIAEGHGNRIEELGGLILPEAPAQAPAGQ